jgi:hypothetical protein
MSSQDRTQNLRSLVELVTKASETVIDEWAKEGTGNSPLPSWELYNAQRTIIAACGVFSELVHDQRLRLWEVSTSFFESRALHIAAEHRVADILARLDPTGKEGVSIDTLSAETGINALKLGECYELHRANVYARIVVTYFLSARLMRMLTSIHIFAEVKHDHFANNSSSAVLVGDEGYRSMIIFKYDCSRTQLYMVRY